jgi:hypothetical protein
VQGKEEEEEEKQKKEKTKEENFKLKLNSAPSESTGPELLRPAVRAHVQ